MINSKTGTKKNENKREKGSDLPLTFVDTGLGIEYHSVGLAWPEFANIRSILGLVRFTLRGRTKVNTQ